MERLLLAEDVAELLRIPRRRVYELARAGTLPSVRFGDRQVRFDEAKLLAWIEAGGELSPPNENGNTK